MPAPRSVDRDPLRRLVAALKGVGSDASKAEALAPALRWCLARGEGDAAELAVEIIETFTVDYAKSKAATSGESGPTDSWRVFTSALVAPSPAPARVAAVCRATPDFVDSLPAARRGELLRILFTAVGSDAYAGARAAHVRLGDGEPDESDDGSCTPHGGRSTCGGGAAADAWNALPPAPVTGGGAAAA